MSKGFVGTVMVSGSIKSFFLFDETGEILDELTDLYKWDDIITAAIMLYNDTMPIILHSDKANCFQLNRWPNVGVHYDIDVNAIGDLVSYMAENFIHEED